MSDTPPPTSSRWTSASVGVRNAATWLVGVTGSAATAVFAGAPIFRSDVDSSTWSTGRWTAVIVLILVGTAASLYVIARLLRLQIPLELTLDKLPSDLQHRIESNELGEYLPGDARSLVEFKQHLQAFANAAIELSARAKSEPDAARKAEIEALADVQRNNRDTFVAKREELYQLAAYELEADRLEPRANLSWLLLGGSAIVAILAMALFTFATGAKPEEPATGSAPTGGLLIKSDRASDLWEKLGLSACEQPAGFVPVFVLDQTDTELHVQTIGLPKKRCARFEFSIPADLVELVKMGPIKITVETPTGSARE